jgi:hypothetical protein
MVAPPLTPRKAPRFVRAAGATRFFAGMSFTARVISQSGILQ